MSEALSQSLSNTVILVLVAAYGWWLAYKGTISEQGRATTAKLVNALLPFFLFYSVTSKFSHDQLLELLKMGFLPFITIAINWLVSEFMVKVGWVRAQWGGTFIACFSGATVMFVGVPMTLALFGEKGIPYLLVYFFANCLFIWTVGLYNIQLDGVKRHGGERPQFISIKSIRMLFSAPLLAFIFGIFVILLFIPIPGFVMGTCKNLGAVVSPLALVFIGMTIQKVGFDRIKAIPREIWLILLGCFLIRPFLMWLVSLPFDMEPIMRQVFVAAAVLPVSSVIAVLARSYGADEDFVSEAVGASTVGLIFALPVFLFIVTFV